MTDTNRAQLVEVEDCGEGCRHAILKHPEHGAIYIREVKNFEGDDYGWWENGYIARVKDGDNLESLTDTAWNVNAGTYLIDAILDGCDNERPLLCWHGRAIEAVAEQAGL